MNRYEIHCTAEQTAKAIKLGALIKWSHNRFEDDEFDPVGPDTYAVIPTASQMIGWLEEKGFSFYIFKDCLWNGEVQYGSNWYHSIDDVYSRETATLAAIDAALDYLINTEK